MNPLLVASLCISLALGPDEDKKGVELYQAGKYPEAAAAFRLAIERHGPSAELYYNLALALWRAGRPDEAETAAEQAATMSNGAYAALRDGVLGNLRFDAAKAAEGGDSPDLNEALSLAKQARDHFERGALHAAGTAELQRNLERALRLIEELEKKIEDQQDQKQEQKRDEKQDDDKQDEQQKDQEQKDQQKGDEKKPDQEQKDDEKKSDQDQADQNKRDQKPDEDKSQEREQNKEQKQDRQQPADDPPQSTRGQDQQEPQPGQQPPEPKPGDDELSKPPEAKPSTAPGERDPDKQLSPEQRQRLLELLKALDDQRQRVRAQLRAGRPKVEKDW